MDLLPYQYTSLSLERREIRLLYIHAGEWHTEIACHLTKVSIDEKPSFETLSYVWGDPNTTSRIALDGRAFDVTQNLKEALRRLRNAYADRLIWIDQLCINQSDNEEKSEQVALMSEIYKTCQGVCLWLGEAGSNGDEMTAENVTIQEGQNTQNPGAAALEMILLYASGKHMHEIPFFQVVNESTLIVSPEHVLALEGINLMASQPYWDRAWTVQEQILPPKATLMLGPYLLPWENFINASRSYLTHSTTCCRILTDTLPLDTRNLLLQFFTKIARVTSIAASHHTSQTYLLDLLRWSRGRQATDERDMVFSVLGLVTNWLGAPMKPDYTLTTLQVYRKVTVDFIESTGSLVILTGSQLRRKEFPSWMQDWAAEDFSLYRYEAGFDSLYNLYNASKGQKAKIKSFNDSVLLIDGYFVDRIVATGRPMATHDWTGAVPVLDMWTELSRAHQNSEQPYIAGGKVYDAFWRCIIGNLCWNGKPPSVGGNMEDSYRKAVPEDRQIYELFLEQIRAAKEGQWMLGSETVALQMVTPLVARHRRFFVTEKGYFGIGTPSTQVGDEVYVLLGSTLPFVARPLPAQHSVEAENNDPPLKCYSMVGECYLQGIMDGEFVSNTQEKLQAVAFS